MQYPQKHPFYLQKEWMNFTIIIILLLEKLMKNEGESFVTLSNIIRRERMMYLLKMRTLSVKSPVFLTIDAQKFSFGSL